MVAYAKEVSITLYTHNDERDILSLPLLQQALKRAMKEGEGEGWGHSWVTRYHTIIKLRGIVSHRGLVSHDHPHHHHMITLTTIT